MERQAKWQVQIDPIRQHFRQDLPKRRSGWSVGRKLFPPRL